MLTTLTIERKIMHIQMLCPWAVTTKRKIMCALIILTKLYLHPKECTPFGIIYWDREIYHFTNYFEN